MMGDARQIDNNWDEDEAVAMEDAGQGIYP